LPGLVAAEKNFSADSQGKNPPQARHLTLRKDGGEEDGLGEEELEEPGLKGTSTRPVPEQTAHRRWIRILFPNSYDPSRKTSVGKRAPSQISGPGV
jgi:hypothetical protein